MNLIYLSVQKILSHTSFCVIFRKYNQKKKIKYEFDLLECAKNIVPHKFLCNFSKKIQYNAMLGVF